MTAKSMMFCEHANECPQFCPCPSDCACKEGMCKDRAPTSRAAHAQAAVVPLHRPSFESIYMRLALAMAERSTCVRTNSTGVLMQVGCAITTPDFRKVISVGYNGNAAGLPNHCDSTEVGACGCIHAEANAVVNCDAPRATEKIVFATHLPCVACAKLLINLGNVREVIYKNDYRIRASLVLFDHVGINYRQYVSD